MTQPYKACPKCQQPAQLTAPTCLRCGHQYRTQFVPPDQTIAFNAAPPVSVGTRSSNRIRNVCFGVLGALLLGLTIWIVYRVLNPYPFIGDWVYTLGDPPRSWAIFRFNRDGSGIMYSEETSQLGRQAAAATDDDKSKDYLPSTNSSVGIVASAFAWKVDREKLYFQTNGEPHEVSWSVSDDGSILTLTNLNDHSSSAYSGRFVRRSTLPSEPSWMKKVK